MFCRLAQESRQQPAEPAPHGDDSETRTRRGLHKFKSKADSQGSLVNFNSRCVSVTPKRATEGASGRSPRRRTLNLVVLRALNKPHRATKVSVGYHRLFHFPLYRNSDHLPARDRLQIPPGLALLKQLFLSAKFHKSFYFNFHSSEQLKTLFIYLT